MDTPHVNNFRFSTASNTVTTSKVQVTFSRLCSVHTVCVMWSLFQHKQIEGKSLCSTNLFVKFFRWDWLFNSILCSTQFGKQVTFFFKLSAISLSSGVKSFLRTLSHKHNFLEADGDCISWRNISFAAWWDLACPMLVQRVLSERILLNSSSCLWAVTAPHDSNPLFFIIIFVNNLLLN